MYIKNANKLLRRYTGIQVSKKDLGTGMGIAVSAMVVQTDAVVIAQIVQLVADARKNATPHGDGTKPSYGRQPINTISVQALPQHTDIKAGIMGNEDAGRHDRLYFPP